MAVIWAVIWAAGVIVLLFGHAADALGAYRPYKNVVLFRWVGKWQGFVGVKGRRTRVAQ